jgi:hypothetical protein
VPSYRRCKRYLMLHCGHARGRDGSLGCSLPSSDLRSNTCSCTVYCTVRACTSTGIISGAQYSVQEPPSESRMPYHVLYVSNRRCQPFTFKCRTPSETRFSSCQNRTEYIVTYCGFVLPTGYHSGMKSSLFPWSSASTAPDCGRVQRDLLISPARHRPFQASHKSARQCYRTSNVTAIKCSLFPSTQ